MGLTVQFFWMKHHILGFISEFFYPISSFWGTGGGYRKYLTCLHLSQLFHHSVITLLPLFLHSFTTDSIHLYIYFYILSKFWQNSFTTGSPLFQYSFIKLPTLSPLFYNPFTTLSTLRIHYFTLEETCCFLHQKVRPACQACFYLLRRAPLITLHPPPTT